MLCQFTLQFAAVNIIGLFAVRFHIYRHQNSNEDHDELTWSWMTSLYWAVQTTTTIGYGDLTVGADFRWFQLFYLIVSTYFVGNALTGFATLSKTIDDVRRRTAWKRREVSKAMIDEMQADDHDDKIDQFEFTVASLLQLGKIDPDDVRLIMDKFRQLCNDDGFIRFDSKARQEQEIKEQEIYESCHTHNQEHSSHHHSSRRGSLSRRASALSVIVPRLSGTHRMDSQLDLYLDD
mmetsp:Transcript_13755/g.23418  ORF Transcript_13755/g.23418 Transcript_13755/m.23418 type:complete len:235 (-) Transcript_13755:219-923(-)